MSDILNEEPAAGPGAAWLEEVVPGVHAWVQPDGSWWPGNAGRWSATMLDLKLP